MPWVSQGVLLGATGPAGPTGGQTTTTSASFVMPALNATKAITVVSAAWTKLNQTILIYDGTSLGLWEITTRTSATALTITNRGYAGTPASGTMATAAVVQLIGPGVASATTAGFIPKMLSGAAALTTFSSFTVPPIGSSLAITVAAITDTFWPANQVHYLVDTAGTSMAGLVQSTTSTTITYINLWCYPGASTVMGAGRVYMGWDPILRDQQSVGAPASAISLSGSPGCLNTLVPGLGIVLTGPPAGTPSTGGNVTIAYNPIVQGFGTVTTNQTLDCTGASSVQVVLGMSTAAVGLALTHLSPGVPVCVQVNNASASAARGFSMTATNPAGTSTPVFWKLSTGLTTMSTGVSVPLGTTMFASGMSGANGQVLFVAN